MRRRLRLVKTAQRGEGAAGAAGASAAADSSRHIGHGAPSLPEDGPAIRHRCCRGRAMHAMARGCAEQGMPTDGLAIRVRDRSGVEALDVVAVVVLDDLALDLHDWA